MILLLKLLNYIILIKIIVFTYIYLLLLMWDFVCTLTIFSLNKLVHFQPRELDVHLKAHWVHLCQHLNRVQVRAQIRLVECTWSTQPLIALLISPPFEQKCYYLLCISKNFLVTFYPWVSSTQCRIWGCFNYSLCSKLI